MVAPVGSWRRSLVLGIAVPLAIAASARADLLVGDLNGDGVVDAADEALLTGLYRTVAGDPGWEPAGDLNGDGRIDPLDLGLFGTGFGSSGGDLDTIPPGLLVTLNDVPDDMNDLVVVPPDGFQITLELDSAGGSVIDTSSLSVTSDQAMGVQPAGSELGSLFTVTPTRAVWEVPAGTDLARTSHYLTVSVRDAAGNQASDVYGYAVRDFPIAGAPLENLQTLFLDFDQDRSLGAELDFLEDLRQYGLSSSTDPAGETQMRDRLVSEVIARAHPFYGRNPDGSPGTDPARVVFHATLPGVSHSRLCVGGESSQGGAFLGSSPLDVNNLDESSDHCAFGSFYGVFPQAIDNLWGTNAEYQGTFGPLDPDLGGTPVGEHALDPIVLAPGFDPATGSAAEQARWSEIENAVDAFAQVVATAVAHETGHLLGLVAHGATPDGLFGGTSGANQDHNVTAAGGTPAGNWLMNAGGTFGFEEITGRGGFSPPEFRPLNHAYLRDRVILDASVTGLFPAPTFTAVIPSCFVYQGASQPLTFQGTNFLDTPGVDLLPQGSPASIPVGGVTFVDPQTLTATVFQGIVTPDLYDVVLRNPDGQEVVLEDGLEVRTTPCP